MRAHSMRFNRPVSPFPFLRAWTIRGHSIRSTKSSSPSAVMASGTTRTDAVRRSGPISETLGPARATARSMAFSSSRTLPGDQRNVLGTLPERGNEDREHVEPVEQVLAELPLDDERL